MYGPQHAQKYHARENRERNNMFCSLSATSFTRFLGLVFVAVDYHHRMAFGLGISFSCNLGGHLMGARNDNVSTQCRSLSFVACLLTETVRRLRRVHLST